MPGETSIYAPEAPLQASVEECVDLRWTGYDLMHRALKHEQFADWNAENLGSHPNGNHALKFIAKNSTRTNFTRLTIQEDDSGSLLITNHRQVLLEDGEKAYQTIQCEISVLGGSVSVQTSDRPLPYDSRPLHEVYEEVAQPSWWKNGLTDVARPAIPKQRRTRFLKR